MPSACNTTTTWTIIRDKLLWITWKTKAPPLNTIQHPADRLWCSAASLAVLQWHYKGKTALCWVHNYHDLLLWSITNRAVGEATINHHYLFCNKSQGHIVENHNSHSLQIIITYIWLSRYVAKVAREEKTHQLHCLQDLASLSKLLSFARKEKTSLVISLLPLPTPRSVLDLLRSHKSGWVLGSCFRPDISQAYHLLVWHYVLWKAAEEGGMLILKEKDPQEWNPGRTVTKLWAFRGVLLCPSRVPGRLESHVF